MEYGSRIRFAIISIIVIILVVLGIWGVMSLVKRVIGAGTSTKTDTTVQKIDLNDYDKDSTVAKVTVAGPIVANEKFVSYQIEIGQNYREMKVYRGYTGSVIAEKRYDNNAPAYTEFLKALKKVNFASKMHSASEDERGVCATGYRYTYELKDLDEQVIRSWNSSCGSGSYGGVGLNTRLLFKAQIPDYSELTKNLGF